MATTETALGLEVRHELAEPTLTPQALESVLLSGDLKSLSAADRVVYYQRVCESVGLNHLTQPFQYIVLNGKLTLYARRDCTEQLRKLHGVSVTDMTTELIGDVYVVRATFTDKTGRTDQATGAVPIKGLQGENLANAYLKAETKCKRRGTLSICGLGMLDETEVDSIPGAKPPGPPATPFTPPRRKGDAAATVQHQAATIDEWGSVTGTVDTGRSEPPPLSDEELAALDREDAAQAQGAGGDTPSGPPSPPAPSVPCYTEAEHKRAKRAHAILNLALKRCPADKKEQAAKLARQQLYLKLTQDSGVTVTRFEEVPAGKLYDEMCNVLIDKAAAWAMRHV